MRSPVIPALLLTVPLVASSCSVGDVATPISAIEPPTTHGPPTTTPQPSTNDGTLTTPLDHTPGPVRWLAQGANCPPPPNTPLALPATDKWDGLLTLRDVSDTLYLSPIHTNVTIDGELVMWGFSRTTADFSPATFDIAPTFVMPSDIHTDADIVARARIFGTPFDDADADAWFCGGHTFLPDGRLMNVGGTRTAKFAAQPGNPIAKRGFGLTYGGILADQGWVRIPRDFIGGEAWYPTLLRLSDGRLIMYGGYFELDADQPHINAALQFNRTIQFFEPKNVVEPWKIISPSASTPVPIRPSNYVQIYELPTPISRGGRDRHLFLLGKDSDTFLMNHVDAIPNAADRFVGPGAKRGAVTVTQDQTDTCVVMLAPFYHAAESTLWRPGSVIAVGGSFDPDIQKEIDWYDPYIDKWCRLSAPMPIVRRNSDFAYLPDGNVIIVNGEPSNFPQTPQNAPMILDPRTGQFTQGKPEPLDSTRGYHNTAALMPDGRVFVGAGRSARTGSPDVADERTDARFYSPYYLGIIPESDRPAIIGIPKDPVMHYKATYEVDYKNGDITSAALIGLSANTHATDFNARYIELVVRNGAAPRGKLTLVGPDTAKIAPPGHYMLFINRKVKGFNVPSVAQIIRVDGDNPTCEGTPINACGGCRPIMNLPGVECFDVCGPGVYKCDGPNKTSCSSCL
jgi:galactose oxidase